jgi:hypothetical protein
VISVQAIVLSLESLQIRRNHNWLKSLSFFFSPALRDRGILAEGQRADIILVDDRVPLRPRIVAVIAAGRLVHLTDSSRLIHSSVAPRKAVAAA